VPELEAIDVLHVSPGTTAGWRRADRELREALESLGASVAVCSSDYPIVRHLRRTVLFTDLAEAAAMRRALTRALRRWRPRAILFSTPQSTMLQPAARLAGATAVRLDVPAARNRRGPGTSLLHRLERRGLGRVRLLLPFGMEPRDYQRVPGVDTPMVALPIPIEVPQDAGSDREALAVTYAGNPDKKGLDLAVRAWMMARPAGWQLVVTGIDEQAGRSFLERRGVNAVEGVEWAGVVAPDRYGKLLQRASLFLSASRFEDFGLAPLEAMAAGALLVTAPSDGSYEALRYVRAIDGRLVAEDLSAQALAHALEIAFGLDAAERSAYRRRARELVQPHSREALRSRLAEAVLPVLFG
jgi:glycosyltransferase involved in cell wall biosynthesis